MLGLTFEKLLVVTIIAAFILGPRRLPIYAGKLSDFVRELRAFVESSRARAEDDFGVPLPTAEWRVDLRQYDPRRIVRDALEHDLTAPNSAQSHTPSQPAADAAASVPAPEPIAPPAVARTAAPEAAAPVESATRQRWIVAGGTSGHPRRVLIIEPKPETRVPEAIDSSTASISPES